MACGPRTASYRSTARGRSESDWARPGKRVLVETQGEYARFNRDGPVAQRLEQWTHNAEAATLAAFVLLMLQRVAKWGRVLLCPLLPPYGIRTGTERAQNGHSRIGSGGGDLRSRTLIGDPSEGWGTQHRATACGPINSDSDRTPCRRFIADLCPNNPREARLRCMGEAAKYYRVKRN